MTNVYCTMSHEFVQLRSGSFANKWNIQFLGSILYRGKGDRARFNFQGGCGKPSG